MEGQEDGAHALERRQSGPYTLVSPIKCHDGADDAPCVEGCREISLPKQGREDSCIQKTSKTYLRV